MPDEDRHTYAEGLKRGGYLLSARVPDGLQDAAADFSKPPTRSISTSAARLGDKEAGPDTRHPRTHQQRRPMARAPA